jgi:integrase
VATFRERSTASHSANLLPSAQVATHASPVRLVLGSVGSGKEPFLAQDLNVDGADDDDTRDQEVHRSRHREGRDGEQVEGQIDGIARDREHPAGDELLAAPWIDPDAPGAAHVEEGRDLEPHEVAALFHCCMRDTTAAGPRDAVVLALGVAAGLRRAEIAGLDVADMDLDREVVRASTARGTRSARYP